MTQIFQLTQQYVENYNLDKNVWFSFAKQCNQNEFLASQEGFYYAVKAFPRILANLASKIDSSKARLLVIENLWEEHGQGNKQLFHTTTYYQYLQSLGFNKEQSFISHQPWVDEWIEKVFNKNYSTEHYAMYIAGIEYIYARISHFISQLVSNYDLKCEQSHYAKHSVLDYEHSKELIETSLLIQEDGEKISDEDMMYYFTLGIEEFLQLYSNMVLLTEKEAYAICQENHAFYYGREDTSINQQFLDSWYKNYNPQYRNADVLMICSGGENAIELLCMKESHHLTLLDINPHQLNLARNKINSIKEYGHLTEDLLIFQTGKFEKIFTFLKKSLNYDELQGISQNNNTALKKLKWICNNAFSNQILEIIFTENATKYSKDNFADHFYRVFKKQIQWYFEVTPKYSNIGSILFDTPPINYERELNLNSSIDYYHGDFLSYFKDCDKSFDLIDLSNISDWMPFEQMKSIVSSAYERLNKNGVIVGRKLLGDYQWIDLQDNLNNSIILPVLDTTSFYTECVFIQKI